MTNYDSLELGGYYSEKYLKLSGEIRNNQAVGKIYELVYVSSVPSTAKVKRWEIGEDDSPVFFVTALNPLPLNVGVEVETSQAGLELIAAPGEGFQIVIRYVTMRTEATSGEAYLSNSVASAFKNYFSAFQNYASDLLEVRVGENLPITLVSSQGAKPLYVGIEYFIEVVK